MKTSSKVFKIWLTALVLFNTIEVASGQQLVQRTPHPPFADDPCKKTFASQLYLYDGYAAIQNYINNTEQEEIYTFSKRLRDWTHDDAVLAETIAQSCATPPIEKNFFSITLWRWIVKVKAERAGEVALEEAKPKASFASAAQAALAKSVDPTGLKNCANAHIADRSLSGVSITEVSSSTARSVTQRGELRRNDQYIFRGRDLSGALILFACKAIAGLGWVVTEH